MKVVAICVSLTLAVWGTTIGVENNAMPNYITARPSSSSRVKSSREAQL